MYLHSQVCIWCTHLIGFQTKGHGRLSLEIGLPLLLLKSNESDFDDAATGIGGVENNTQVGTKNHSRDQNLQKGKDNTNTDIKSENIDDISDKKAMSGRNRIPPAHILPKPLAVHRLDNRYTQTALTHTFMSRNKHICIFTLAFVHMCIIAPTYMQS